EVYSGELNMDLKRALLLLTLFCSIQVRCAQAQTCDPKSGSCVDVKKPVGVAPAEDAMQAPGTGALNCLKDNFYIPLPDGSRVLVEQTNPKLLFLLSAVNSSLPGLDSAQFSVRETARDDIIATIAEYLKWIDGGPGHAAELLNTYDEISNWLAQCKEQAG